MQECRSSYVITCISYETDGVASAAGLKESRHVVSEMMSWIKESGAAAHSEVSQVAINCGPAEIT